MATSITADFLNDASGSGLNLENLMVTGVTLDTAVASNMILARSGVNKLTLRTTDVATVDTQLTGERAASSSNALAAQVTADAVPRFVAKAGGEVEMSSGAGAADLRLQRRVANVLNVDNGAGGAATLEVDNMDSNAAGTLAIGPSIATKLELADTGVTTEVQGTLNALSLIDGDTQSATPRFRVGTNDSLGRRQVLYNASSDADPDGSGAGYGGDGPILRIGSLTADGDAVDVISEGAVLYGQATGVATMSNTDFAFARIKPTRFQLREAISSTQRDIFRVDDNSMEWRNSGGSADVFNLTTTRLALTVRIDLPTGAAGATGTSTLVGGTVTVATTAVTASSIIQATRNTPGGTVGDLSVPGASIIAGTSFVINSASGTDTSTVNWVIFN